MRNQSILIDPILKKSNNSLQINPLPVHISDFAIDVDNISSIDVLCISHDHWDHLDYSTIMAINDKVGDYIEFL